MKRRSFSTTLVLVTAGLFLSVFFSSCLKEEYLKNEDGEGVMHVVDVSPSVQPEIGSYCTDDPVNNAIDVVALMTTDLKNQVKNVKATDANSTNLFLNNGVEIAVGTSENLREKERVCQDLLERYNGKISYINVRNPNNPTWRSI